MRVCGVRGCVGMCAWGERVCVCVWGEGCLWGARCVCLRRHTPNPNPNPNLHTAYAPQRYRFAPFNFVVAVTGIFFEMCSYFGNGGRLILGWEGVGW